MLLRNLEQRLGLSRSGVRADGHAGRNVRSRARITNNNPVLMMRVEEIPVTADIPERPPPTLPPDWLSQEALTRDRIPQESRFSEDHGYVHVSSLVDMCPRQWAIARRHQVSISRSPTGAMQIIWVMGLAAERHYIAQLAEAFRLDNVRVGLEFRNEEYGIVGRPDAAINADGWWVVLETKSMNKRDWERLQSPVGDHVLQAALYRELMSRSTDPREGVWRMHPHVVVTYICKDYLARGQMPYKEFHINTEDPNVRAMVAEALLRASEVKRASDTNVVPQQRLCTHSECSRAKACPVVAHCYNMPGVDHGS